jgi:predicted transport protein
MSKLKAYLNIGINHVNDPLKKAKDYAKFSGKIIEITIKDRDEIPYALTLIEQAYERN